MKNTISTEAERFIADEWAGYKTVGKQYHHETINHIKLEYVRKGDPRNIHTSSIENFWSLFNRGVVGSFHKVSVKHLRRYLESISEVPRPQKCCVKVLLFDDQICQINTLRASVAYRLHRSVG